MLGIGGFDVIEREHTARLAAGPAQGSPLLSPAAIVNLAAGHVSMRFGARVRMKRRPLPAPPAPTLIGDSFRIIQHGDADVMLPEAPKPPLLPWASAVRAMRALSTRHDDPARASRPWDRDRDGFVMGEGAASWSSRLEHARRRGAPILAEFVGYGVSADACHMTQPAPSTKAVSTLCATRCATRNSIQASSATSTPTAPHPLGDRLEAHAIRMSLARKSRSAPPSL